jgi:hypothetical protein
MKKAANTKTPARRPPQSKAAKERVRRHLAGERPLSLDPAEAAGAAFISLEERARARFAKQKQEKEAEAEAARLRRKKSPARPPNPRRKPRPA